MEEFKCTLICRSVPNAKSNEGGTSRRLYLSLDAALADSTPFFDKCVKQAAPGKLHLYLCLGHITSGLPIQDFKLLCSKEKRAKKPSPAQIAAFKRKRAAQLAADRADREWWIK